MIRPWLWIRYTEIFFLRTFIGLIDLASHEIEKVQGLCEDCPDHEACITGWPCWKVKEMREESSV